jgi:predicted GH43/DUF377 family glycosyl hydrolase
VQNLPLWRLAAGLVAMFAGAGALAGPPVPGGGLRLATFDVDATPPLGSAMAYQPVKRLEEMTLRCRGIVLTGARRPIVLCAVDWIGIANQGHDAFCAALAEAAGTTPDRVAVHTLHQHDAPGCDFTAERLVRGLGIKGYNRFDGAFHRQVIRRAADAIRRALPQAQLVTHYGWGAAEVCQVASNRRIKGPDGRVRAMRGSTTKDPALRAEPEGVVDRELSLLSFWNNDVPLAVLSYYACHPQSYYLTGIPSPDFPGIARFIRGQDVPAALNVHFNGAGGNIAAGKYNDGNKENRMILATRLADAMRRAFRSTRRSPLGAGDIDWQTVPVALPPARHLDEAQLIQALKTEPPRGYVAKADQLAWLERCHAGHQIAVGCLSVGKARVLHLPGELFVEYQLAAKAMRPDLHVMMAAYGDYGPGYIGLACSYREGGYETGPGVSNVSPGAEAVLMGAIGQLLGVKSAPARPASEQAGRETAGGWRKSAHNPVLGGKLGTCFDVALLTENHTLRMWFSWRPEKSVALCESNDGVHWSRPAIVLGPDNQTGWEANVNRPVVIRHAGLYRMWYTGQDAGRSWIGYATSPDGKTWTRMSRKPVLAPEQPWEKGAVMCPHVMWDPRSRSYRMWYSGGEQYEPDAIGYATSPDGLAWTKHPGNPVFTPSPDAAWEKHKVTACQVIRQGGWHLMFYIGFGDVDHAQIGLARSRDGISGWQRHAANPIIRPGRGAWDHDACYKPFAILDGDRWLLWYNGRRGGAEQIGLATHDGADLGF